MGPPCQMSAHARPLCSGGRGVGAAPASTRTASSIGARWPWITCAVAAPQYSTVQYSEVQYSEVQYSAVQYSECSTVQYSTVQCSTKGPPGARDSGRRAAGRRRVAGVAARVRAARSRTRAPGRWGRSGRRG
eukprot:1181744-Prorocentrum_minimum.AAC.1